MPGFGTFPGRRGAFISLCPRRVVRVHPLRNPLYSDAGSRWAYRGRPAHQKCAECEGHARASTAREAGIVARSALQPHVGRVGQASYFADAPERRGRRRAERNLGGLLAVQPKTGPLRQRPGLQDATVGRASPAAGGIPLPWRLVWRFAWRRIK